MPRARPGARKTTARRRIQRYIVKVTHHVTPLRVKRLLPAMLEQFEEKEPPYVECETPTMAKLEELGVPTEEWPYYIGFMKRMLALYKTYTGLTLLIERAALLTEYYLRGYDVAILAAIDEVAAGCAGVPYVHIITCDDVKACLTILTCEDVIACLPGIVEVDYTAYAFKWKQGYFGLEGDFNYPVHYDETNNAIYLLGNINGTFTTRDLDTGLNPVVIQTLNVAWGQPVKMEKSAHEKYFAYVIDIGAKPILRIYKDGVLLQSIDLSVAPVSWPQTTSVYTVVISAAAKYIFIENRTANEYVIFEGS